MEMNKAERMIWSMAQAVVASARGKSLYDHKEAVAKFEGFTEMALVLEATTQERIDEIKEKAKAIVY